MSSGVKISSGARSSIRKLPPLMNALVDAVGNYRLSKSSVYLQALQITNYELRIIKRVAQSLAVQRLCGSFPEEKQNFPFCNSSFVIWNSKLSKTQSLEILKNARRAHAATHAHGD